MALTRKRTPYVFYTRLAEVLGMVALAALAYLIGHTMEHLRLDSYKQKVRLAATVELTEVREDIEKHVFQALLSLDTLAGALRSDPGSGGGFDRVAPNLVARDPLLAQLVVSQGGRVTRAYPQPAGLLAEGMALADTPGLADLTADAAARDEPSIAGPLTLPGSDRRVMAFARPVAESAEDGATAPRMATLLIPYGDFIESTDLGEHAEEFDLLIQAAPLGAEANAAADATDSTDGSSELAAGGSTVFGNPAVASPEAEAIVLDFDFAHGAWTLFAAPVGGWPLHAPGYALERTIMIAIGALVLGLAALVLFLSESRRTAQNRLIDGIEAMQDGFAMFDRHGRLIMANRQYRRIYDRMTDLIRPGMPFATLRREARRRGQFSPQEAAEPMPFEDWTKSPDPRDVRMYDGRRIRASDHATPEGNIVGLRIDVTELEQAKEAAEAASHAKSEFMSTLSHELRTPLTVILGYARIWKSVEKLPEATRLRALLHQEAPDPEEMRKALEALLAGMRGSMEKLEVSGAHLLTLVNDMLDYAKIESGTLPLRVLPCSIQEITGPVVDSMSAAATSKGLTFRAEIAEGEVLADAVRCRQVLFNLLGNAVKFTDAGEVALVVERRGGEVLFHVSDTGTGIDSTHLERIFEAFHQADSSDRRKASGTGLGLTISQRFAMAQGGEITVSSEPGRGSTFTLTLPVPEKGTARIDAHSEEALRLAS